MIFAQNAPNSNISVFQLPYYTMLYYIFRFLTNLHLKIKKSRKSKKPAENELVLSLGGLAMYYSTDCIV